MGTRNVIALDKRKTAVKTTTVVLYARVSSKDQEKEGFSIPAQLRLLRDYATSRGFAIAQEFTDIETARVSGRTYFTQMLLYLKKHRAECRTILVEKTDRLYRNIKDYAILDELDLEVHFVKENEIISRSSRSHEQLIHGIKVLMARNYSQNLGEETVKGMTEKARTGIYPSCAPIGYRNVDGPSNKRVIIPDRDAAPVIADLFQRFATGRYSVKALVKELNAEGLQLRGRKLYSSMVHQILRRRLYSGDFEWDGSTHEGIHEPLVSRDCWQHVQELLDARAASKTRKVKHDFAFTGLIHCGHCGCLLVGEIKKRRYVYYHCTGNRGKCQEPYTRAEILTEAFGRMLQELVIAPPILEWLDRALLNSDRTERAAREMRIRRLQAQHERLEARIDTMYIDKLDRRISEECFHRNAAVWRSEQQSLAQSIRNIKTTAPAPIQQGVGMLRLMSRTSELFLQQPPLEQRRFLQLVFEKAIWQGGELQTTMFEPFQILRHSNQESRRKHADNPGSGCDLAIWLPDMDSNHD